MTDPAPSAESSVIQIVGHVRLASRVHQELVQRGFAVRATVDADAALERFRAEGAELVILCLPVDDRGGRKLLGSLFASDPRLKVVVVGSDLELPTPADGFEAGAFEHIMDPLCELESVVSAVGLALGSRRDDRVLDHLCRRAAASASLSRLIARDEAMQSVVRLVRVICRRATQRAAAPSVLLIGETGTGKGVLARTIHYNGARRTRPLVEVNCATLLPNLLESELFGHERGAFTGARSTRIGLFETAQGGTLLLDEITSLPLELQPKLLTALEEKRVRRVGGQQAIDVDVQVIAAAQPRIREDLESGRFRWDLFHRLNVISIIVPPLRERGEDKVLLAESFVAELCSEHGTPLHRLTPEAARAIQDYPWPGNVRELRNNVERALMVSRAQAIEVEDLDLPSTATLVEVENRPSGIRLTLPDEGIALSALERAMICESLVRCEGNVSAAARYLQISRSAMIYRMGKHGIVSW